MDKYVKPTSEELIVRYPTNKAILPKTGGWVPFIGKDGRYWRRRLKDKSIKVCNPPSANTKNVSTNTIDQKIHKRGGHK